MNFSYKFQDPYIIISLEGDVLVRLPVDEYVLQGYTYRHAVQTRRTYLQTSVQMFVLGYCKGIIHTGQAKVFDEDSDWEATYFCNHLYEDYGVFVKAYINGGATIDDIQKYIDDWHDGDSVLMLSDFLGLSQEQYELWREDEDALEAVLNQLRIH